jgi:hypothetical protein
LLAAIKVALAYRACNPNNSNGGHQCSVKVAVVAKEADDLMGLAATDTYYLLLMLSL